MDSNRESLNKRIRETISDLSDEALVNMLEASPLNYTPFARQAAQEELSRRRQSNPTQVDISRAGDIGKRTGCCIELWSDRNFEGEYLRIEGPVEYPTLNFAGLDWSDKISSMRVGTSAFVMVYADTGFGGVMMSFGPGEEVANLEGLRFNDEIDSIKLVNSMKVFDGSRADAKEQPIERPAKKRRPKPRGRKADHR